MTTQPAPSRRVALFLPNLCSGGAERITVHLANGLVRQGYQVDMVLIQAEGAFLADLSSNVRVVNLNARRVLRAIPRLASYLRSKRPDVLISALDHVNIGAILAKRLSGTGIPTVVAVHVTHSRDAANKRGVKQRVLRAAIRWCYRRADAIVCVSRGVADDLVRVTGVRPEQVRVIYNPVITDRLQELAHEPVSHPWFAAGEPGVIMAVGSLTPPKDFATLIRAFALLHKSRRERLMILGEGPERNRLESLLRDLGLEESVTMPGFDRNPYSYLARAALFVLSSAWEALPTVLIEALAVGTPVVATDCQNGPREILRDGEYGELVPVGDAQALACAMSKNLSSPRRVVTPEAILPYALNSAVDQYCHLITELTRA